MARRAAKGNEDAISASSRINSLQSVFDRAVALALQDAPHFRATHYLA
jgi:hypothetical protein